jgi:hypothetical protein
MGQRLGRAVTTLGLLGTLVTPTRSQEPYRPWLAGNWSINRALTTARGATPMPPDGLQGRPVATYGSGMGGSKGIGGPPNRGRGIYLAPPLSPEDIEARKRLMREVMEMPKRLSIEQDGDRLVFTEPGGIVRIYLANNRAEKHQLVNGTIETRTRWEGDALLMEVRPADGVRIQHAFAIRGTPRRLEIATTFDGLPKDVKRLTVYDAPDELVASPQP